MDPPQLPHALRGGGDEEAGAVPGAAPRGVGEVLGHPSAGVEGWDSSVMHWIGPEGSLLQPMGLTAHSQQSIP